MAKWSPDMADEIAEFFYSASKNAKYGVSDLPDMKRRLATILAATMALIRTGGPR